MQHFCQLCSPSLSRLLVMRRLCDQARVCADPGLNGRPTNRGAVDRRSQLHPLRSTSTLPWTLLEGRAGRLDAVRRLRSVGKSRHRVRDTAPSGCIKGEPSHSRERSSATSCVVFVSGRRFRTRCTLLTPACAPARPLCVGLVHCGLRAVSLAVRSLVASSRAVCLASLCIRTASSACMRPVFWDVSSAESSLVHPG